MDRRLLVEGWLGAVRSRGRRLAGWLLHPGQRRRELSVTGGGRRLPERVAVSAGEPSPPGCEAPPGRQAPTPGYNLAVSDSGRVEGGSVDGADADTSRGRARRAPADVARRARSGAGRPVADLWHRERRVAQLRGEHRRTEVLAARPDRRRQLRRPGDRVALGVGRRHGRPDDARRQRVVGAARDHRRLARGGQPEPLPAGASPAPRRHAGDAAHGRRRALLQHRDLAGRGGRRRDRRDAVGLQPEELRGGDHPDDRHVPAAGGGVLDRR